MSTNQEQKQQTELSVWKSAYKNIPKKHCPAFTSKYLKLFKQCHIDMTWHERPDIRLECDDYVIGIEHFLFDMLSKNKDSHVRQAEKKERHLFETYCDDKIIGQEEQAVTQIMNIVQQEVNQASNMDYKRLQQRLHDIFSQHSGSAYRTNLSNNHNNKPLHLGLLIELRYPLIPKWRIYNHHHSQELAVNGCPLTFEMIKILEAQPEFDFIIIYMADPHNQKHRSVVLDAHNLLCSARENNILVCDAFESPYKGLHLTGSNINADTECVHVNCEFSANKPKGGKNGKT